ncbi:DUF4926 domain-containing protein [Marinoscillum furvescens]|uniref:Uncharacterized protein DUF4926 n=1 Tax=Marinoscillum furvescens DSM 4134 TaxID=1122208 RepID=A0A3D9KYL7_MARFU|nr:DUF4926 domain-containing protein [Marinoscillum furvescens]RED92836.1 uncharacterized protein DUF4926 [Marinoscillum furvescens DSM 4134]
MIKLYDEVVLTEDIGVNKPISGDIGVVVHIHGDHEGYEVEFMTLGRTTLTVETVSATQVRPVLDDEVPHARRIG